MKQTFFSRKVHTFFGFGTLNVNKDGTVDYMVKDFSYLLKIREHFVQYPLRGKIKRK